ncbi:MAG: hypothetical protein Q9221_004269 [Calogaya cf. arnoldii]
MIQPSIRRLSRRIPRRFQCAQPIATRRRRYKCSAPASPTIYDVLEPEVIEDGAAVADGDGSNVYQNPDSTGERWEVPRVPMMDISIDDKNPEDDLNLAKFLRYRGPPILPHSEVVYVVHPFETTQIYATDAPPEGVEQDEWNRVCRAIRGEDIEGARILAFIFRLSSNASLYSLSSDACLDSRANLRAVPSNIAALASVMIRLKHTGEWPNYEERWAETTVWGYNEYLKVVEKQHEEVTKSLAKACHLISTETGVEKFKDQFRKDFQKRLMEAGLDETYADDRKGQNDKL